MTSKQSSLLPRDEALGRNLITFDREVDSSDNLSLKSCPAFRPSWTNRKKNAVFGPKPKWASSSSLSDIREGQPLTSEQRTRKEPPDKYLGEDMRYLIENEWKRRINRKPLDFAALQTLARKQRADELNFQKSRSETSTRAAESDTTLRTRSSHASKHGTGMHEAQHSVKVNANNIHAVTKPQPNWDTVSFFSKSCTIFGGEQNSQSHRHSSPARASKSVHDEFSETAHITGPPVLGVQELKRRFAARTKKQKPCEEGAKKESSKLTQTSFTDARLSGYHTTSEPAVEVRREETYQRSWNTRVTEIEITEVAELLPQENEEDATSVDIYEQAKTQSRDSVVNGDVSVSSGELRAKLASYFEQHQRYPETSDVFSGDILPPPPEFNCEYLYSHQPTPDENLKNEPRDIHPAAAWQRPPDENLEPVNTKPKQRRPASGKACSQNTRSRCTQTPGNRRPGRRRSRRVTYSPSEVSGPSDRSEDQWSTHSDRARRHLSPLRRSGRRRSAARGVTRREEPMARGGGSRPVSGRSSQRGGSRPVSGRSNKATDRPTLLEEVHRKARSQRKVVTVKRRRSKRKVFQVPKNMPEAISRFLEQLSKDKEAIRVIHKMSLVTDKK